MRRAVLLLALLVPGVASAAPIVVSEWRVIGPFESGSREGMVHPLAEPDGSLPASWDFTRTWPSALADGGRVAWSTVRSTESGEIPLDLQGVSWDARQDEWGVAALPNVAVLAGSFDMPEEALLLVDAARCSGTIAGQPFAGDPYGAGIARSVVRGRKGRNEVTLLSAGFGPKRTPTFRVEVVAQDAPAILIVENDLLLPDRVQGRDGSGFVGVPLLNMTEGWIDVSVSVDASAPARGTLAPLAPLKIAVPIAWGAHEGPPGPCEVTVRVDASARQPLGRDPHVVSPLLQPPPVRASCAVRAPGAPRRETFLSAMDGSAQEYGLLPSRRGDASGQALVMSTHGAGVDALGQVSSYGVKDDVIVVAPTNRRPYGFDWHDWGRLDFEEVLAIAKARPEVDPDRVHLTGHSMGGHGAWLLGALHADESRASRPPRAGRRTTRTFRSRRGDRRGSRPPSSRRCSCAGSAVDASRRC